MRRHCACSEHAPGFILERGGPDRDFEPVVISEPTSHGPNITRQRSLTGLYYCTSCGAVVFVPEEKRDG